MTEEQIFLAALDLSEPTARAAYLDKTCGRDTELRRQVEALLAAHFRSGEFLDVPVGEQVQPEASHANTVTVHGGGVSTNIESENEADDLEFLTPTTRPDSLGRLGHYEVLQVLGKGGFGIVFRAFDDHLQRVVAVKVLASHLAATSPARKRFLREARSSAKVRHENVVQVYAVEEQPLPHLVMEFVPGETLQERLDRTGPLEPLEVVQIGRQIAEGLAAAHATGLIHRDIKPANILIESGPHSQVKITDFGLARAADDASLTQSGVVAGTPMYMAPEQAQGDTLDHRADLFSLGSVLYAICSGRPPFRASSTLAVLKRVTEDTPRPIPEIIPEAPRWLCDIISRLHAKNPDDRFATAREVADLLERGLTAMQRPGTTPSFPELRPVMGATQPQQGPSPAQPRETSTRLPATKSRSRTRYVATAAAVLLMLVAGLGFTEASGVTNVRGTVIRLFSPEGTLVVEVDDPEVSIQIDGSDIVITGAGAKEIRLKPGNYTLEASKHGKVFSRELVSVTKNDKKIVRVSLEAPPADPKASTASPEVSAWERAVAAMPAEKQVEEVRKELKRLNPGFDGVLTPTIKDGVVTGLKFKTEQVTNVSPVRALTRLVDLDLGNWPETEGALADLSPLQGMPLEQLKIGSTKVADLSPLKGMKLNELQAQIIPATDLTPLQGMPLTTLDLHGVRGVTNLKSLHGMPLDYLNLSYIPVSDVSVLTGMKSLRYVVLDGMPITDLTPLRGLKLIKLSIMSTSATDLTVLKELPLTYLRLNYAADREQLLRSLKGLAIINDQPASEFWTAVDRQAKDPDRRAAWYVLSAGGTVRINGQEQDINATTELPRETFQLTGVRLDSKQVSDVGLASFRDCKNLTYLSLWSTPVTDAGLANFKECKNLTYLGLAYTKIGDAGLAHFKDCKKLEHLGVEGNMQVTDAGLANFKECKNLTHLGLAWTQVSDRGLGMFKDCKKLRSLSFGSTQVSDAGLVHFKDSKELERVHLDGTQVTDAGLAIFKDSKKLTGLLLTNNMRVTDAGLAHLKNCENLTELFVQQTKVTAEGVDAIKTALPKCKIEWDGGVIKPTQD